MCAIDRRVKGERDWAMNRKVVCKVVRVIAMMLMIVAEQCDKEGLPRAPL